MSASTRACSERNCFALGAARRQRHAIDVLDFEEGQPLDQPATLPRIPWVVPQIGKLARVGGEVVEFPCPLAVEQAQAKPLVDNRVHAWRDARTGTRQLVIVLHENA